MTDRPSRSPSRSPNHQRSTSFAGARLHFNYTGKEQKIRSRHDTPRLSNTPTSSDSNRLDYGQYDPKSRSRTGSSIEVPVAPQKSSSPSRRVTQPVYFEDLPQTASLYGPSVRKSPSPSRRQTQQVNTQDLERARVELYSTSVGRNWLHPNQNQEVSSYRPTSSPIQNQSLPTSSSYIPNSQNPNLSISQNQKQTSSQVLNPQNQNPSLQNPIVPTSTSSRPSLYTGHSRYNTPEAIRRSEDFRSQRDSDGRLGLGAIGRQRSLGPLEASTRPQESYTAMHPLQRSVGASELQGTTIGSRRPQEGPQAPSLTPRYSSLVSNSHESPGPQGSLRHSTSVSRQPFDPSYLPITATPPRNPSFSSYSTYDTPPVPVPQPPPPVASSSFISKVLDPFGQIPKQNLNPPRPPPHQRSPRSMTLDVASSSQQQSDIEEAKRRILENQKMIEKAEEARKAAVRAREEAERKEKLRREEEEKRREEAARKAAETARKVAEETARKAAEEAARLAAMEDEDEEVTKFIHRLHEQIRDSRESKNAMGALGGRRINTNLATNAENLTNVHKNEVLICVF